MKQKYELLAPAGNFRNLKAAVDAGADAVYFGVRGFNMRDSARNFSLRDLDRIRRVCDSSERDVKMYLTLNVVVYDSELRRVEEILRKVVGKVDAVICWDLAVLKLCRKYKIAFHVSTQASVSNVEAAKFYKELGAERIVLARELSLKQVGKISKVVGPQLDSKGHRTGQGVELEAFCHGAMCVAVSGRCFMSEHVHGLSANRGKCAQPCRRNWSVSPTDRGDAPGRSLSAGRPLALADHSHWIALGIKRDRFAGRKVSNDMTSGGPGCARVGQLDGGVNIVDESGNELRLENSRVMSAKDLCALPFVEEMKKVGVKSFKIEGRNRGPEYVSTVVHEYRKAIDAPQAEGRKQKAERIGEGIRNLKKVYNRGFSSGFYLGTPTSDDFSFSENGEQSERKEFVGKVYKFWRKAGVCSVLINTGRLRVGDEVYLISPLDSKHRTGQGDEVGIRRSVVKSMQKDRLSEVGGGGVRDGEVGGGGVKLGEGKKEYVDIEVARKGDDVGVRFARSKVAGGRLQEEERIGSGTEVYVIRGK